MQETRFYKLSPKSPPFSYSLLYQYILIIPVFAQWDSIWIMPDRVLHGMNCRLILFFLWLPGYEKPWNERLFLFSFYIPLEAEEL